MSELEEALGHKVTDMDAMMNELLNEVTDFSEPTQKAIDQMIGSNEGNLRQRFASVLSEQ